jgi:hypothetical protein
MVFNIKKISLSVFGRRIDGMTGHSPLKVSSSSMFLSWGVSLFMLLPQYDFFI